MISWHSEVDDQAICAHGSMPDNWNYSEGETDHPEEVERGLGGSFDEMLLSQIGIALILTACYCKKYIQQYQWRKEFG